MMLIYDDFLDDGHTSNDVIEDHDDWLDFGDDVVDFDYDNWLIGGATVVQIGTCMPLDRCCNFDWLDICL